MSSRFFNVAEMALCHLHKTGTPFSEMEHVLRPYAQGKRVDFSFLGPSFQHTMERRSLVETFLRYFEESRAVNPAFVRFVNLFLRGMDERFYVVGAFMVQSAKDTGNTSVALDVFCLWRLWVQRFRAPVRTEHLVALKREWSEVRQETSAVRKRRQPFDDFVERLAKVSRGDAEAFSGLQSNRPESLLPL